MTEQELRELDAWIAEHVMGWKQQYCILKRGLFYRPNANGYTANPSEAWCLSLEDAQKHECRRGEEDDVLVVKHSAMPHYTTDPAAAMAVLQRCIPKADELEFDSFPNGDFRCFDWNHSERAPTLPLAIALFARKLFGGGQ